MHSIVVRLVERAQLEGFAHAGKWNLSHLVEPSHTLRIQGLEQAQAAAFVGQEYAAQVAHGCAFGGKSTRGLRRRSMRRGELVTGDPG